MDNSINLASFGVASGILFGIVKKKNFIGILGYAAVFGIAALLISEGVGKIQKD